MSEQPNTASPQSNTESPAQSAGAGTTRDAVRDFYANPAHPERQPKPFARDSFKRAERPAPDVTSFDFTIPDKLPDGVEFDRERAVAFQHEARRMGLTREQQQRLVDLELGRAQHPGGPKGSPSGAPTDTDDAPLVAEHDTWKKAAETLPAEMLQAAREGFSALGGPDVLTALHAKGHASYVFDHPDVVALFARVGQALRNGKA